ncbi:hypothetical protein [Burkholderia pyrrocinia]|uniref:hypothetical protein n=1 Tax=Burkholderia pyrrocinia TaxID=60550 RepID=UPI002AB1691F|nr:hypothetical protein [Burkholderia pyrrocinia]
MEIKLITQEAWNNLAPLLAFAALAALYRLLAAPARKLFLNLWSKSGEPIGPTGKRRMCLVAMATLFVTVITLYDDRAPATNGDAVMLGTFTWWFWWFFCQHEALKRQAEPEKHPTPGQKP